MSQSQQLALSIDGNAIPQDKDGHYSLNDLHKASGGLDKHSPKRWVRLKRTKNLIAEIDSQNDLSTEKRSIKSDKKAGTFVCAELVYTYAMAISPKFELKVIRGFHEAAVKEHRLAKLHGTGIWNQNRELGKLERRDLTDSIQLYVNYATAQGSRGAHFYFSNITRTTRSIMGVDARDEVSEQDLHLLSSAECIVEKCLLECMAEGMPYKTLYGEIKRRLTVFRDLVVSPELEQA